MGSPRIRGQSFLLSPFNGLLETNICESDYPRHAIVYIPTADLGQNL